jgi:hypothetical protein
MGKISEFLGRSPDNVLQGSLSATATTATTSTVTICASAISPAENRLVPIIVRDEHSPWDGHGLGLAKPSRSHYVPEGVARRGGPPLTSLNPDP